MRENKFRMAFYFSATADSSQSSKKKTFWPYTYYHHCLGFLYYHICLKKVAQHLLHSDSFLSRRLDISYDSSIRPFTQCIKPYSISKRSHKLHYCAVYCKDEMIPYMLAEKKCKQFCIDFLQRVVFFQPYCTKDGQNSFGHFKCYMVLNSAY